MTVPRFVSTGSLPGPDRVQALVDVAHRRHATTTAGEVSDVYPALARADPSLFGIAVVGVTGRTFVAGDALAEFPIMSVSKPFVFALVVDAVGPDEAKRLLGTNATGLPFNAIEAVDRAPGGITNPMVNPGAIATTSLVPGGDSEERWHRLLEALSRFAARALVVDDQVYASASATNHLNRALVARLARSGAVYADPAEALDLYTRQCSLAVSAFDLATMGATLADGGVNPRTGEQVVSERAARHVLAVMATAGLYETSGEWLYDVGLPAKSGIGGGIVTVSPGKGGLGTFSPPLDPAGNSVRGVAVAEELAVGLGLDLFASAPV